MRKLVDPQDEKIPLNVSVPIRVKDRLKEEAGNNRQSVSAFLSDILKREFGMK